MLRSLRFISLTRRLDGIKRLNQQTLIGSSSVGCKRDRYSSLENLQQHGYSDDQSTGRNHASWAFAGLFPIYAVYAREDAKKQSSSLSTGDDQKPQDKADPMTETGNEDPAEALKKMKDLVVSEIASKAIQMIKVEEKKLKEQRDLEDEMEKFEVKSGTIQTRFDHVIGNTELKTELRNILKFMKDPEKYSKMGAKLPNGCLISGPPGIGKTMLARAMAGESNGDVLFYSTRAVDFCDHSSGVERLRGLFKLAKLKLPSIIFIDDIERLPKECLDLLHDLMDGFHSNHGVFLLAATASDDIPEAFARPGRFDLKARLGEPDVKIRLEIIRAFLKRAEIGYDDTVSLEKLADDCFALTGAEICNIINHAVISATNEERHKITAKDLESARDKVMSGLMTPKQDAEAKLQTAYHEAGHTLVQYYSTVKGRKLRKITIIPRGDCLGMTYYTSGDVRLSKYVREEMVRDMEVALGGRVAEEIAYGVDKVSTGASADLNQATGLAMRMVKYYGFSRMGIRVIEDSHVLGDELQSKVDTEMANILQEAYERVKCLLTNKQEELKRLAEKLAENEELSAEQVKEILEGGSLHSE